MSEYSLYGHLPATLYGTLARSLATLIPRVRERHDREQRIEWLADDMDVTVYADTPDQGFGRQDYLISGVVEGPEANAIARAEQLASLLESDGIVYALELYAEGGRDPIWLRRHPAYPLQPTA